MTNYMPIARLITEISESSSIINDRKFLEILCSVLILDWLTEMMNFLLVNKLQLLETSYILGSSINHT
jgi:hypothetical protein